MSTPFRRIALFLAAACCAAVSLSAADIRIGIVGLDTSHVTGFARLLHNPSDPGHIPGGRIVAAYKGGSPDVDASITRIEAFTEEMTKTYGVKLYPSIEEMADAVDAIMICSVDGRHARYHGPMDGPRHRYHRWAPMTKSVIWAHSCYRWPRTARK